MIPPAGTNCPPYTFTPRYCGLLSRPFLLEPPPFLCAINHRFYLRFSSCDLRLEQIAKAADCSAGRRKVAGIGTDFNRWQFELRIAKVNVCQGGRYADSCRLHVASDL